MNRKLGWAIAGLCTLAMAVLAAVPACAQMAEVKEKPPMYSYIANWAIPRAQWAEMDKQTAANQKMMEKGIADGNIIGYGTDTNLIHQSDGQTQDNWWSSMSMAGLLNVLEQSYKSGSATAPVLLTATKHWDNLYVSRYYNWHPGSWTGVYTRVASYQLKPDAPTDAVDTVSKNLFVPMLEKLLADGALHEYEIDTQAIHTDAPGMILVVIIAADGAGLDKFNAAVRDLMKSSPLAGPALSSMVDFAAHRDELARTNATYK
jgi:hypothetical protein